MNHSHRWVPIKKGYEKCLVCQCGAMHVRGVQVGDNTITMSPSGVGDVIRWSATQNALALGDLGMNVTTGRPSVFVSGAARALIHTAEFVGGAFGNAIYGDGSDGTATLVATTTLAADGNVVLYSNLTMAGFSLTSNSADITLVVYVSGTLSFGGGTIAAQTFGSIVSGGSSGGGGGTGGVSGISAGAAYVYANTTTGSGTVRANGTDASQGGGGSATAASNSGGSSGSAGSTAARLFSESLVTTAAGPGGGGGGSPGGGGAGGVRNTLAPDAFQDCNRFMLGFGGTDGNTVGTDQNDRWTCGTTGASGGGGGGNTATGSGGGGGGGGGAFIQDGGLGGSGGTAAGVNGTGSGGGGGGGTAGVAVVIASTLSAVSVQATGGTGGPGGPASPSSVAGGGGGGGGSGGVALVIGQNGHSGGAAATAGASGAGGTGAGPGGTSGAAGGAGVAFNSAWS